MKINFQVSAVACWARVVDPGEGLAVSARKTAASSQKSEVSGQQSGGRRRKTLRSIRMARSETDAKPGEQAAGCARVSDPALVPDRRSPERPATFHSQPSTLSPQPSFRSPLTTDRWPLTTIRSGFTLVELLIVISIIAMLAALLLPALGSAKMTAQALGCKNNLRQISMTLGIYLDDNNGVYPVMNCITSGLGWPAGAPAYGGGSVFGWQHYLYSYLGAKLHPGGARSESKTNNTIPSVFICPRDTNWGANGNDISYGMTWQGGVTIIEGYASPFMPFANCTYPQCYNWGMVMRGGVTKFYELNSNGTYNVAYGFNGGTCPAACNTLPEGPYILPAESNCTPDSDQVLNNNHGVNIQNTAGTVLRHGQILQYISVDLAVRTIDLAGTPYSYAFMGPNLPGIDGALNWYRVNPGTVLGSNPYTKSKIFSSPTTTQ